MKHAHLIGIGVALSLLASPALLTGCAQDKQDDAQEGTVSQDATRLTGLLRGDIAAVGGDTTGWALATDDGKSVEIDVSAVGDLADRLESTRVTITGAFQRRQYVTRGVVPVFVVETMTQVRDAQRPPPPGRPRELFRPN